MFGHGFHEQINEPCNESQPYSFLHPCATGVHGKPTLSKKCKPSQVQKFTVQARLPSVGQGYKKFRHLLCIVNSMLCKALYELLLQDRLELTNHLPARQACEAGGQRDSCIIRKQGFKEAGIIDPTKYII